MMKVVVCSAFVLLLFSNHVKAQTPYEVYPDSVHKGFKVYKGILDKDVLLKDTSFHWYAENQKYYTALPAAVDAIKKYKDSIELLVYMGTWCDDSHYIIPRLYKLTDASGFDTKKITLLGTDRYKKTLSHLSEALNVYNVPTIIVMKKGKELGRIVEYGKYGLFDKELAEILNAQATQ